MMINEPENTIPPFSFENKSITVARKVLIFGSMPDRHQEAGRNWDGKGNFVAMKSLKITLKRTVEQVVFESILI